MTHRWAVDQATGEFLYGGEDPYDCAPGLSPGQIRVVLDRQPKKRADRYDATAPTRIRAATTQEIAAHDAALDDADQTAAFDSSRIVKALALVVGDLTGQTPAQMRALVKAKYKAIR